MDRKPYFALNLVSAAILFLLLVAPAQAVMTHRYSFNGNANDSVGTANWTVNGGATFSGGQVVLDGVDDFLSLAATPLPTAANASTTIEVWGTYTPTTAVGSRIFDFSNGGNTYLYLTPLATPNTPSNQTPVVASNQRLRYDDGLGEFGPMAAGTGNTGQPVLYTVVIDRTVTGGQLRLFRDGGLIATEPGAGVDILSILGAVSTSNRLGHGTSSPSGGDLPSFLTGSFNEMRIYDNPRTDTEILINAIAGPDTIVALTDKTWNAATSNWNTGANWTVAGVPSNTNRAVINNGGTATVSAATPTVGGIAINNGALTVGTGGSLQATYAVDLAPGDANTATVNVNGGGRLSVAAITADALLGAKTLNIDNGTIQAGYVNAIVQAGFTTNIGAGGATIDTQANTMTWTTNPTAAIAGAGTVTKTGSGTLNLFSTTPADRTMQNPNFTGEFRINQGIVDIAGNSGVFGRAGTRQFGDVTMTNSTLLLNTGGGTAREFGADLNIVGDNVITNTNAAVRELRMQGSYTGNGTVRFRKPNVADASGLDFEADVVNFPNVTNAGFTGRIVIEDNYAIRFRSTVADNPIDFPNAILELADTGSWVGKRGPDGDLVALNSVVELGGVESVGGVEDPLNPGTFFYPRLEACIAGCGVATNPLMTYQIGGASQNAEFRGIVQDNQVLSSLDTVKVIKVGANTQTFSGPNTYSGTTTVNGGRLLVNGTHAMSAVTTLPVGDYTVNAGGTLGGTGTIGSAADAVDVLVNGGTVNPGASVGTLTVEGAANFNAASHFAVEISGNMVDLLVADTLNITSGASLDILPIGSVTAGQYTIAQFGSRTGTFTLNAPAGFSLTHNATNIMLTAPNIVAGVLGDFNNNGTVDAADYVLWRNGGPLQNDPTPGVQPADYTFWRSRFGATSGTGSVVGTNAVPEPTAAVLVLMGCALLGLGWQRR